MSELQHIPLREWERLRTLPVAPESRAGIFADAARFNALYAIKRAGSGHIGSSFSSLDIVSWLHLEEMTAEDVYFSSKGHDVPGLYAVLTGLGRLDFALLHRLRRLGGLPGHPDVSVPGIAANTGSLGMGISKAKGIVQARRLLKKSGRVFVLLGDGELQEGQIWESMPQAAHLQMGEITVIVDANRIQSDLWVSKVNDVGDLIAKAKAFGWHGTRVDGHDLAALGKTLAELHAIADRPKFIVADTVKGKGVSFMEGMGDDDRLYHFHSGSPGDLDYERAAAEILARINGGLQAAGTRDVEIERTPQAAKPPAGAAQNLVAAYSRELLRQAERNPKVIVLDGDLAKDCGLLPFEKKFPERFIECGIAEQDMVSQAGAMARQGLLPIVHSFSCFLSTRPNEQIYNNALERAKVIYMGSLAGFLPAGPGSSHQAVRDISTLAALPDFLLIEPSCNEDFTGLFDFAVNRAREACYFRLVSVSCDISFAWPSDYSPVPGQGVILTEGDAGVVFAAGPLLLTQAFAAVEALARSGTRLRLVALPWLNRIDSGWLRETVGGRPWVFTLDNHYLNGGQGERILAALAESKDPGGFRAHRTGLAEKPACGAYEEVLRAHRMDSASLAADWAEILRGGSGQPARAAAMAESDIG